MQTDDFLERLARDVTPVTPLPRPWLRAAAWLLGAVVYLGVITLMMTSSADVAANWAAWWVLLPQVAAIATSTAAAAAAFASVVPGSSPRALLWTAAAAALWLGGLILGSIQEWSVSGAVGLAVQREWWCVALIVLGGAIPAVGLALMLRHGAPLTPRTTTALAVLAAAGLANVSACVTHPHTSNAVVLIWHGSTVLTLVAMAAWTGRSLLTWDRLRRVE